MGKEHYYHMFANGDDAKNFITTEEEFKTAFNRFAVCQYITGVSVLSFSVEDTHPHALLWGEYEKCLEFKNLYNDKSIRNISRKRGSIYGVKLECDLLEIDDEQHLMNTGTYTITQATKDGKAVMPYDYLYGTGSIYFRNRTAILPWMVDSNGNIVKPVKYGDLNIHEQWRICGSKVRLPKHWLICNGFILPTNYVDIKHFESIYRTHNCFRVFMANNKSRDEEILNRMSSVRGIVIEDMQARKLCEELCIQLFDKHTTRHLTTDQRIHLAKKLRLQYHLSYRQLSTLSKVPETELRKYIK